ncbi:MAG: dephospho-CoA kinase [Alphaproteobacteria bacterium]
MIVIGLTGSIGMGKSTAANMLRRMGIPVSDADAIVHNLMTRGGDAVAPVDAAFPGVVKDGAIDRAALGQAVFGNPEALRRLERIVHPLVGRDRDRFLRQSAQRRLRMVVLDVPLLYETGGADRCDTVILVSAPAMIQQGRVMRRPGMTLERLQNIRRQQMPNGEKRRRAEFVAETGLGRNVTLRALEQAVRLIARRKPRHWPPAPQPRWRTPRYYARSRPRY